MLCEQCVEALRTFYYPPKERVTPQDRIRFVQSPRLGWIIEYYTELSISDIDHPQCCWINEVFTGSLKKTSPELLQATKVFTLPVVYVYCVRDFFKYEHALERSGLLQFTLALDHEDARKSSKIELKVSMDHKSDLRLELCPSKQPFCPCPASEDAGEVHGSDSTLDLPLVEHWMHTCLLQHWKCHVTEQWQPARLLQINAPDSSESVRLVLTEGMKRVQYAAFSHRWPAELNSSKYLRLLRRNLEDFQGSIDPALLPAAMRDSINILRRAGISHIWIDALCIVQDDVGDDDWLAHVEVMHKIYQNARFTFSLSGLDDSSKNLERRRCPKFFDETWISEDACCRIISPEDWQYTVIKTPLGSRGWVFQERLLSSRILHIGKYQSAWECRETSHLGRYGESPLERSDIHEQRSRLRSNSSPVKFDILTLSEFHNSLDGGYIKRGVWLDLINNYTSRSLTKASDITPAFSGFASAMFEATATRCIYGLRVDQLPLDLAWMRVGKLPLQPQDVVVHPDIPSWSWASMSGECILPGTLRLSEHYMARLRGLGRIRDTHKTVALIKQALMSNKRTRNGRLLFLRCWICRLNIREVDEDGEVTGYELGGAHARLDEFRLKISSSLSLPQLLTLCNAENLFFMPTAVRQYAVCGILISRSVELPKTWVRVGAADFVYEYHSYAAFYSEMMMQLQAGNKDKDPTVQGVTIAGLFGKSSQETLDQLRSSSVDSGVAGILGFLRYCGVGYASFDGRNPRHPAMPVTTESYGDPFWSDSSAYGTRPRSSFEEMLSSLEGKIIDWNKSMGVILA